jgi:transposase
MLLKSHFDNVLTWFKPIITNAVYEELNSKIKMLKASAGGFHGFSIFTDT